MQAWYTAAVARGQIVTCDMVRLELLKSARNASEFAALRFDLRSVVTCPIGPPEWSRALDVYERLAEQGGGHQRSVGHADLLIASAAEAAGATVLHYDSDFDRIAEITGQPTRWVLPRGSV
jgi:predicted nucleic acid-binding protein